MTRMIFLRILLLLAIFVAVVFSLVGEAEQKQIETEKDIISDQRVEPISSSVEEGSFSQEEVEDSIKKEEPVARQINSIPGSVSISVPFSSQAPFGVWDDVHEEACEETSLIMIKYYLEGKKLTPEIAEKEIQELKEYQLEKYGHYKDSSMAELVEMAEDYYGVGNLRIVYDFGKDEIKRQLARKNPVIIPTAGRLLGNPYFTSPGPLYHNLVLIGYEGNTIIANDPGTKRGEGYKYSLDVVYEAIHDFEGSKEGIEKGRKAMIVME